eukprot:7318702-Pyramimonas_sp.AAC.1
MRAPEGADLRRWPSARTAQRTSHARTVVPEGADLRGRLATPVAASRPRSLLPNLALDSDSKKSLVAIRQEGVITSCS